jgi:hypothetical protein
LVVPRGRAPISDSEATIKHRRYAHVDQTRIALAAALILGALGTASAVLAGASDDNGGSVMPGSMDGVDPAYHPAIFGNPNIAKVYGVVDTSHGWTVGSSHTARQQANP